MRESKNIIEKIWEQHLIPSQTMHDDSIPPLLAIDLMLIHEVTSAQAFDVLRSKNLVPFNIGRLLATLDHSIPTRKNRFEIYDDTARLQVETLRRNCKEFEIPFYDFESGYQGIVHVIGPELGLTQPGMTIVCGDSHTSTHGAFGALAFGVGTSEVGHVLATNCILQKKPKTMKIAVEGQLLSGVFAKDVIMRVIGELGIGGANNHIIEYCGGTIASMSMDERMTVCNMSIECGARAGLVSPDATTFNFIKNRPYAPKNADWNTAQDYWLSLRSDEGAKYDKELKFDVAKLSPMITWGTNPGQALEINSKVPYLRDVPQGEQQSTKAALEYVGLKEGQALRGVPVDWAFVGSCTNGRIEDLRIVAKILKGRKIKDSVTMYVVPGSESVLAQAKQENLDRVIEEAGASFRMPGCSMCLGMNDDLVPAGKRCVSSSNRNFVGRQGPNSITHLASPATVAASAIEGCIVSAEAYL
jgi:3-isopropylmalate/(R)-2-methylmalate dehydratase large subunit